MATRRHDWRLHGTQAVGCSLRSGQWLRLCPTRQTATLTGFGLASVHDMNTMLLNNGAAMPVLGLGVFQMPVGSETERTVISALENGYRLIDTAALYKNEESVGRAIKRSGVPRGDIFVTTKLHPMRFWGVERAFQSSLDRLGMEYVDLFLIHWPFLRTGEIWKTLQRIQSSGRAKAIGVSNFRVQDIEALEGVPPAVNQVEFHPFLYRKALLEYSLSKGIVLEAHSPLTHGKRISDPRIRTIADRYGKSSAQLLIRWSLQHGLVVVAKTLSTERLKENASVFDFEINEHDMTALDGLSDNYHAAGLSRVIGDPA